MHSHIKKISKEENKQKMKYFHIGYILRIQLGMTYLLLSVCIVRYFIHLSNHICNHDILCLRKHTGLISIVTL